MRVCEARDAQQRAGERASDSFTTPRSPEGSETVSWRWPTSAMQPQILVPSVRFCRVGHAGKRLESARAAAPHTACCAALGGLRGALDAGVVHGRRRQLRRPAARSRCFRRRRALYFNSGTNVCSLPCTPPGSSPSCARRTQRMSSVKQPALARQPTISLGELKKQGRRQLSH